MADSALRLGLVAAVAALAGFAAAQLGAGRTGGGARDAAGTAGSDGRRGGAGPDARSVAAGHELSDLDGVLLQRLTLALLLVAGAMVGGMVLLRTQVQRVEQAQRPAPTATELVTVDGPGPHLQTDPLGELADLRARQRARTDHYGWNGPTRDVAHVPVARAMELLAGQALQEPPAPHAAGRD